MFNPEQIKKTFASKNELMWLKKTNKEMGYLVHNVLHRENIILTRNWRTVCPADGEQNQTCWQIHSLHHKQERPWECLFE